MLLVFFLQLLRQPPITTLFPYTTLFRSVGREQRRERMDQHACLVADSLGMTDRKSTRLNSSHRCSSYAVFCLKKKSDNPVGLSFSNNSSQPSSTRGNHGTRRWARENGRE